MKIIGIVLFVAFLFCGRLFAQEVISSQGDYYSNGVGSLSFTIGEPIGETYSGASYDLTQGFQQVALKATLVEELTNDVNIQVYPNPVVNYLTINMGDYQNQATFTLYDTQGKLLKTEKIKNTFSTINFSIYAKGVYFLSVLDNQYKKLKTYKIIKQ